MATRNRPRGKPAPGHGSASSWRHGNGGRGRPRSIPPSAAYLWRAYRALATKACSAHAPGVYARTRRLRYAKGALRRPSAAAGASAGVCFGEPAEKVGGPRRASPGGPEAHRAGDRARACALHHPRRPSNRALYRTLQATAVSAGACDRLALRALRLPNPEGSSAFFRGTFTICGCSAGARWSRKALACRSSRGRRAQAPPRGGGLRLSRVQLGSTGKPAITTSCRARPASPTGAPTASPSSALARSEVRCAIGPITEGIGSTWTTWRTSSTHPHAQDPAPPAAPARGRQMATSVHCREERERGRPISSRSSSTPHLAAARRKTGPARTLLERPLSSVDPPDVTFDPARPVETVLSGLE